MTSLVRARVGRFAFGADYNPEQWPESVWDEDMALMKRAGVSMVTAGIFSSPDYLELAGGRVERLARRYAGHPSLAMWHIGNEYGCHVPECYCDTSAAPSGRGSPTGTARSTRSTMPGRPRSGPSATPTSRRSCRRVSPDLPQPGAAPGLQAVLLRRAARLLPHGEGHPAPDHPGRPGHHQLRGRLAPGGRGPDTRAFREVAELGAELGLLDGVLGSTVDAQVALVTDWSSGWAVEGNSLPTADLKLEETNLAHYRPLWAASIATDVVPASADLSGYRLVVVPNLYAVDEATAAALVEYVRGGGHLVMSFFSGIVDGNDRIHLGGYPPPFRELLGLHVEEFWPLPAGGSVELSPTGTGTRWSEWITVAGAEATHTFDGGELAGRGLAERVGVERRGVVVAQLA